MTTKGLKIQDVGESGHRILSALTKWMMVSEIASETGLSNTTIRRVIQRLETFGLVREELQYSESNGVASSVQSKHFNLTKEGRAFLKRVDKHVLKPEVIDILIAQDSFITKNRLRKEFDNRVSGEEFSDKVFNEPPQTVLNVSMQPLPIDLVIWLRQKAQEFNAMADDLSVYED